MKTSRKGLEFIAGWEGCELEVYSDAAGYPACGVRHRIMDGEDFSSGLTYEQAMDLLSEDIRVYENAVNRWTNVSLAQRQYDALVSFTFSLDELNFSRSTLLKRVNSRDFAAVPFQLARWNRGDGRVLQGLVRRRQAEGNLFSHGIYEGPQ